MARVHTRKARKDYPAQGIKAGDTYYTWATRTTVGKSYHKTIHRSLTPPKSTSSSAFEQAIAEISFDGVEDAEGLREIAQQIREIGEEEQGKFDNMPEGLQQGDTGQMLEERASNCESWAEEIDQAADALETKLNEIQEAEDAHEEAAAAWDHYDTECEDADEGEEVPEPEMEDPRDRDYDQERADAISEAVEEATNACPM